MKIRKFGFLGIMVLLTVGSIAVPLAYDRRETLKKVPEALAPERQASVISPPQRPVERSRWTSGRCPGTKVDITVGSNPVPIPMGYCALGWDSGRLYVAFAGPEGRKLVSADEDIGIDKRRFTTVRATNGTGTFSYILCEPGAPVNVKTWSCG